jgi:4-diphosphocytidyl-2-C-methyl-D-erythritol kinase
VTSRRGERDRPLAGASSARVAAQAKINLFLRVLAREESGYHQLETLFARLELADGIVVRVRERGRALDCGGPAMPEGGLGPVESNLAWRAAALYQEAAGWPGGFEIGVEKVIPVGGGLGGGSADAGAVLRALNSLNPDPLPQHGLFALAGSLGADVPFLAAEAPLALAWGRGERMMAFPALPGRPVALLIPPFGVATPEAFRWLTESRRDARSAARPRMLFPQQLTSWDAVTRLAANDLEPVVASRHPEIESAREALSRIGARAARMTGSGSTVFGLFDAAPSDADAAALGDESGCSVVMTRTAERVVAVERGG